MNLEELVNKVHTQKSLVVKKQALSGKILDLLRRSGIEAEELLFREQPVWILKLAVGPKLESILLSFTFSYVPKKKNELQMNNRFMDLTHQAFKVLAEELPKFHASFVDGEKVKNGKQVTQKILVRIECEKSVFPKLGKIGPYIQEHFHQDPSFPSIYFY